MTDANTIQARWHFGIPIYEKHLPLFAERKDRVVEKVLAMRERDTGITRSNQGGWHSADNLHLEQDDEDIRWLMERIGMVSATCIKDFEGEREYYNLRMVGAWVNINEKGQWNAPHQHLPNVWSGVFYVDAGEKSAQAEHGSLEGDILFYDPLPLGKQWRRPPTVSYQATTGNMLLFPSFLTHMVAPYHGDRPRISIAFNLHMEHDPEMAARMLKT